MDQETLRRIAIKTIVVTSHCLQAVRLFAVASQTVSPRNEPSVAILGMSLSLSPFFATTTCLYVTYHSHRAAIDFFLRSYFAVHKCCVK